MKNNINSKRIWVKISFVVTLCMIVMSLTNKDVLAGGVIAYNHAVYCCDCGDSTRATERLQYDYIGEISKNRATAITSITVTSSSLDGYEHILYVDGRCKGIYGKLVEVGKVSSGAIAPRKTAYEHIWNPNTNEKDYFGSRVKAKFIIKKYGSVGEMTSFWHKCD